MLDGLGSQLEHQCTSHAVQQWALGPAASLSMQENTMHVIKVGAFLYMRPSSRELFLTLTTCEPKHEDKLFLINVHPR